MINDQLFESMLNLPEVKVSSVRIDHSGHCLVHVESRGESTRCHCCGRTIDKPYGHSHEIKLRHLSIFGRNTYVVMRPKRYQCVHCSGHPTSTERCSWYDPKSPHTKAYEERIVLLLVNSTVEDVSQKEAVGYDAVLGIIERQVDGQVDGSVIKRLDVIGIDEIALKKGHQDFVAIVTTRVGDEVRLLAVLSDRKKATVKAFFASIPKRLRKTIKVVCSDMYDGFVNAAKEVWGHQVKVVIDRFHVAKGYRQGLETLRKSEMKRLKDELSEADYKQLKGVMWILRKQPDKLSDDERETLARLFRYSPSLELAYTLQNRLTAIFDEKIQRSRARRKIQSWIAAVKKSGLTCFNTFLATLGERLEDILNYFTHRYSSGFVEGLNNKIKVIKRRCYGILRTDQLFRRIHLDLSGYAAFA